MMKTLAVKIAPCIIALLLSHQTVCAEIKGVTFQETLHYKGQPLVLNGMGMRLATLFKVEVYAAGLYLPEKTNNAKAIILSKSKKIVRLVFKRKVEASSIQEAWTESFEKQCRKQECTTLKPYLAQLNNAMVDMKKGDEMLFRFDAGSVEIYVNNTATGKFNSHRINEILLTSWVGNAAPNKELKKGLLGYE